MTRLRERLAGLAELRDDPAARVGRCRGKSYLDLLRQRAGDCEDAPDAVVAPASAEAVQAVLAACAEEGVAVVPFGGGTSVVGGLEPLRGSHDALISLDLGRLEGIESFDERSQLAWLGGGTRLPEADHALGQRGYMLGHTPQSYEWATVGGCVATRSAGQSSTGHGRIEENVVALRCATPAGELANLPVPATAAGPALKQLVMGSEGMLGAITSVGLRVFPLPAARRYEGFAFRDFEAGWDALRGLAQDEMAPDVARLSDEAETRMSFALAGNGAKARAMGAVLRGRCVLVCGWEGSEVSVALRRKLAAKALRGAGGWPLGQAPGEAWAATRYAGPHLRDDLLDRGVMVETLETATTWSNLAALRVGGHARARGLAARAARALPRLARLPDRRLALLHRVRGAGPRRSGRASGAARRSRPRTRSSRPAARSPTTTRWGRITRRGWAPRPASSASTCCARSRSAATRPGS